MSIQRLRTEKRFSEIVIHNGTVYLAGQLADDYAGDIRAQTARPWPTSTAFWPRRAATSRRSFR